jgi:hypothetical protein
MVDSARLGIIKIQRGEENQLIQFSIFFISGSWNHLGMPHSKRQKTIYFLEVNHQQENTDLFKYMIP